MKITSLELPKVYAAASAAGAEVVAVRAVTDQGMTINLPAEFGDSKDNIPGAKGFALVADEAPDGKVNIQVRVRAINPAVKAESAFIDPSTIAAFIATAK
jgi:hypothetical protein